jgi:alkylation response protein AidB-like acyl-CoA dehydrogenase
MDFQPSPVQQELQRAIRAFCETRFSAEALPAFEQAGGLDRRAWRELAELGVFQLRLPETNGGLGLGLAEAVLVYEELGRRVVPGPLAWTQLAAGLIDGAGSGDTIVGGLDLLSASPVPYVIEHREFIDALMVLREAGVYRVDPAALECEEVDRPTDPLTPIHLATSLPDGEEIGGPDLARSLRLDGMSLVAAQLLGIAEATLEIALAFAKERKQFDRTIGSFQAIKHLLSDMFARQELARAAVYAAGASLDHPEVGNVEQSVRGAKLVAGEAALKNARTCIQIHGGMGYTWEVPDHYYLKRCWVLESTFGAGDEHADRIAVQVASPEPESHHVG